MSRIQEKFDIDYWSQYVIDWDIDLFLQGKNSKGVIWGMRHEERGKGFFKRRGEFIFFLPWDLHYIFLDFLLEKGYDTSFFHERIEHISECEDPFDLPQIVFRDSPGAFIDFYDIDTLQFLGGVHFNSMNSVIWRDSERIGTGSFFSFGDRKKEMETFLKIRTHPQFPLDEYKKVLRTVKRNSWWMHSKVRNLFKKQKVLLESNPFD